MSAEHYGTCALCGSKVPVDILPEHLSEHGIATASEIRDAVGGVFVCPWCEYEMDPELDVCPSCGGDAS